MCFDFCKLRSQLDKHCYITSPMEAFILHLALHTPSNSGKEINLKNKKSYTIKIFIRHDWIMKYGLKALKNLGQLMKSTWSDQKLYKKIIKLKFSPQLSFCIETLLLWYTYNLIIIEIFMSIFLKSNHGLENLWKFILWNKTRDLFRPWTLKIYNSRIKTRRNHSKYFFFPRHWRELGKCRGQISIRL